jgi:putative intracellular protease/amidase
MSIERGRVLVLCTNHDTYRTRSDGTGLWVSELADPQEVLEAAGWQVDLASPAGGAVPLDERSLKFPNQTKVAARRLKEPDFRAALANSTPVADVDPAPYSAIYLTGGHGVMWDFRGKNVAEAVGAFWAHGKAVAAVCHGPSGLVDALDAEGRPLVAGRKVTGFANLEEKIMRLTGEVPFSLEDELRARNADYVRATVPFVPHVVVDGRLVTGQNPASAKRVGQTLAELLDGSSR